LLTLGYGIFALENVNVGSADGGGGNSDQCILRADIRDRFVIEDDPPLPQQKWRLSSSCP
jgi:hypothetical protein